MQRSTKVLLFLGGLLAIYLAYSGDDFNPDSIRGKNVLVTGASSGIGADIAYHYARMGANVVITARRENLLQNVIEKCKELGHTDAKFGYVVADMSSKNDTKRVIESAVQTIGGLDHLMLNHAILTKPEYWESADEDLQMIERVVRVNFMSFVYLTSHAMPYLVKSQGSIGVASSVSGKSAGAIHPTYSASKFSLDGFFNSLRQQHIMRGRDVSTTLIIYGLIDTDKAQEVIDDAGLRSIVPKSYFANSSAAALSAIKATTQRRPEVYVPAIYEFTTFLSNFRFTKWILEGHFNKVFRDVLSKRTE